MLDIFTNLLLCLAFFALMEGVAWATHKYVMHGFLWSLHEDHHDGKNHRFEKNDLFAFFFAMPAVALFVLSLYAPLALWPAIGVTLYGVVYFGFHDIVVHRRLGVTIRAPSRYLRKIIQAHRLHHAVHQKHGAVSFGFLISPDPADLKKKLQASGVSVGG